MSEISIDNGSTYDDADGIEQFDLERLWPTICEACDPVVLYKAYDAVWPLDSDTDDGRRAVLGYVLEHVDQDIVIG